MANELQVVEICAGAGGQALGLHEAGFQHRVAVEYDPSAARTLAHNLSRLSTAGGFGEDVVAIGDVTDPHVWDPRRHVGVDLLAGGPPCPPFSDAGQRLGAADERDLYAWSIGLVAVLRPRAVMLENVKGLSRPRFAGYRQAVTDRLADLGYVTHWRMVHASDHGVAQTRPRYVLIAINTVDAPYFAWPSSRPAGCTVGTVLHQFMAAEGWMGARRWADAADSLAPTIVGGSRKHGGADLGPTGSRRRWAALGVDGRSVADRAPAADFPVDGMPRLTPSMLAALQGFPTGAEGWWFAGSKTSKCRQIGNAFPSPVARALGEAIRDALQHATTPSATPHVQAVHCPVFKVLRQRNGEPVGVDELTSEGLTDRQITTAVANLRRDFQVHSDVDAVGRRSYRLLGWLPTSHGHADDLPISPSGTQIAA